MEKNIVEKVQSLLLNYKGILDLEVKLDHKNNSLIHIYIKEFDMVLRSNLLIQNYLKEHLKITDLEYKISWSDLNNSLTQKKSDENISNIEYLLINLITSIVQKDNVYLEDNFFEIGGDSLKSLELHYKLKEKNINLDPRNIIKYPKIQDLAKKCTPLEKNNENSKEERMHLDLLPPINKFFEQNYYNPNYYNNSWLFNVNIKINEHLFEESVMRIVELHKSLRLHFKYINNTWKQYYKDSNTDKDIIPITYYDIDSNLSMEEYKNIANYHHQKINLVDGPLIKLILFRRDQKIINILLISHKLILDRLSTQIFLEDLSRIYYSLIKNNYKELLISDSHEKWSKELEYFIANNTFTEEEEYLKKICAQAPIKENKNDYEYNTQRYYNSLDLTSNKLLNELIRQKNSFDIYNILITSFGFALSNLYKKENFVIESDIHGREQINENVDLSHTIGYFITHYPILLNINPKTSLLENWSEISNNILNIPNNGKYIEFLSYLKNLDYPDIPIAFDYQGKYSVTNNILEVNEFFNSQERDLYNLREYELEFSVWFQNDVLTYSISYTKNVHTKEEILRFSNDFNKYLNSIINQFNLEM
ncbi:condensation domain-containing protein [Staphylococcus xylosus]|uniref:condensation domain-containing protein n=1 Tax=Staphylococcus xylosus TaxID=1288 RepID=UPI003F56ABCB